MEAATLEAPALVHTEPPASVIPQPTVAEILDQHLDHSQQKKIAVENLSSIQFLIAPDGKSADTLGIWQVQHGEGGRRITGQLYDALTGGRKGGG